MRRYRVTMYYLSATAAAVEGNSALSMHIIEKVAETEREFKAELMDEFSRSVDDEISFGPVTDKGIAKNDHTTRISGK